ncbi:hypothetical protein E2C01_067581 [Portunus trituberculatus]|uniref:Uncharacterized protein n=1 Tax=Portunus trituberculatus TaxID=210409 RepID=A0A5B7HX38_PORTR|nr:hypothetical protein [Portunus trituberculatus]
MSSPNRVTTLRLTPIQHEKNIRKRLHHRRREGTSSQPCGKFGHNIEKPAGGGDQFKAQAELAGYRSHMKRDTMKQ